MRSAKGMTDKRAQSSSSELITPASSGMPFACRSAMERCSGSPGSRISFAPARFRDERRYSK